MSIQPLGNRQIIVFFWRIILPVHRFLCQTLHENIVGFLPQIIVCVSIQSSFQCFVKFRTDADDSHTGIRNRNGKLQTVKSFFSFGNRRWIPHVCNIEKLWQLCIGIPFMQIVTILGLKLFFTQLPFLDVWDFCKRKISAVSDKVSQRLKTRFISRKFFLHGFLILRLCKQFVKIFDKILVVNISWTKHFHTVFIHTENIQKTPVLFYRIFVLYLFFQCIYLLYQTQIIICCSFFGTILWYLSFFRFVFLSPAVITACIFCRRILCIHFRICFAFSRLFICIEKMIQFLKRRIIRQWIKQAVKQCCIRIRCLPKRSRIKSYGF